MPLATGLAPGETLASYRIERLIGRGGMGTVYLAEHLHLERKVALKVLPQELAEDPGFRERFIRESRLAASLEHAAIVPVYDAQEVDGVLFLAMRYIEGEDLKQLLARERSLSLERTLTFLGPVAEGLQAAHERGLVHRDVKPANILIEEPSGRAYVSDFGLAKLASVSGLTRTGSFLGTVDYCAPEQIEGQQVDRRTDVYSLGCVAFQCLTGQPPFVKESEVAVIKAHLQDPPPALSTLRPELPRSLDGVVATAMAKYPEVRYRSCPELVQALRQAASGAASVTVPTLPLPPPATGQPTRPERTAPVPLPAPLATQPARAARRRWPWLAAAAAALIGIAAAGAALVTMGGGTTQAPAAETQQTRSTRPPPPLAETVAGRLRAEVVPAQRGLTDRVSELQASSSSFARLRASADRLERTVLRTQGWAGSALGARSSQERALLRSLERALTAQAAYARQLANLPAGKSSLSEGQAEAIISRAEAAENAYLRLSGVSGRMPSMPLRRSDHVRLRGLVPREPEIPEPVEPPGSLTTFSGSWFSIDYPADWRIEDADTWKTSYYDTTIRSSRDPDFMLRIDWSPSPPPSLDAAARPVVQALERQSGYRLIAYRRTAFQGRDAIYWEFLVPEGGRLLRMVDIFFFDSQGNGFGLLTQAPADQWGAWASRFVELRNSLSIYVG